MKTLIMIFICALFSGAVQAQAPQYPIVLQMTNAQKVNWLSINFLSETQISAPCWNVPVTYKRNGNVFDLGRAEAFCLATGELSMRLVQKNGAWIAELTHSYGFSYNGTEPSTKVFDAKWVNPLMTSPYRVVRPSGMVVTLIPRVWTNWHFRYVGGTKFDDVDPQIATVVIEKNGQVLRAQLQKDETLESVSEDGKNIFLINREAGMMTHVNLETGVRSHPTLGLLSQIFRGITEDDWADRILESKEFAALAGVKPAYGKSTLTIMHQDGSEMFVCDLSSVRQDKLPMDQYARRFGYRLLTKDQTVGFVLGTEGPQDFYLNVDLKTGAFEYSSMKGDRVDHLVLKGMCTGR